MAQLSAAGQFLQLRLERSSYPPTSLVRRSRTLRLGGVTVIPPESAGAIEHPYGSVAG